MPDVMTVPEAAEYLRTTTWHLYKLIREGQLPCARFGKAIRLRRKVLDLMLDGCVIEED